MHDPERILLVRLSHLGDVVHALAVFHALHAAYPRARIAWAVQPEFSGLLEGLPGLERTILFDRRGGPGAWWRLRRALRAFAPELAVDAQGNAKSAAVTLFSGAPRRLGLARADWREPAFARVLNAHAARAAGEPPHAMDRMAALCGAVGGSGEPRRDVALSEAERDRGRRHLDSLAPDGRPPLLLSVSSPGDVRSWPEERWGELLASLPRPAVVLSGL